MPRKRVCIVTHVDADAVAAAATYIHCSGLQLDDVDMLFVPPRDLPKALTRCASECQKVVVMDLGLNPGTARTVIDIVRDMVSRGITVEWYDHHVWENEWVTQLTSVGVRLFIDRSLCAAGIVSREVCGEVTELASIACSIDLWRFDRWEAPFFYRIVEWYSTRGEWRELVKELISVGCDAIKLISMKMNIVEDVIDVELREITKALSSVDILSAGRVKLCVYAKDERSRVVSTSLLCNAFLGRGLCDIAVVIRSDLKALSFRSAVCNVREVAKLLGGGGHPRAAGAPLRLSVVYKLALKLLKSLGVENAFRRILVNYVGSLILRNAGNLEGVCRE